MGRLPIPRWKRLNSCKNFLGTESFRKIHDTHGLREAPTCRPAIFLLGFMNNTVFLQNPVSIDDLKIKISVAIDSIHVSTLKKVFKNLKKPVKACIEVGDVNLNTSCKINTNWKLIFFLIQFFRILTSVFFGTLCITSATWTDVWVMRTHVRTFG